LALVDRGVGGTALGGSPFTVANVTAQAGDLLCCYVVAFSDGVNALTVTPSVVWGPNAVTDSGFVDGYLNTRIILSYLSTLPITAANSGTQTITVTDSDAFLSSVAIYTWTIQGVAAYKSSGDDIKDLVMSAGPIDCPITVADANSFLVFYTFQGIETLDGAAYTAGATPIRSDYLPTDVPGRGSIATFQTAGSGAYRPGRVLRTPPRNYFAHAMAFK
jgi:hypothetical protein